MGKSKGENAADVSAVEEGPTYEQKLENVSVIAKPMAPKKLSKKLHKLIRKG